MRYHEIADPKHTPTPNLPSHAHRRSSGSALLLDWRQQLGIPLAPPQMLWHVDCHRLAREEISDTRFQNELRDRRDWLRGNCVKHYEIEGLREGGRLVGRRFLFECQTEATAFKISFARTSERLAALAHATNSTQRPA